MQITFKAKSRNTFPAEQIYQNVIYVKFMKKHKLYTVEYKSGIYRAFEKTAERSC